MIARLLALTLLSAAAALATPAVAQQTTPGASGSAASNGGSVGDLVAQGFEIKASSPSGNKFIVFLQKGTQAYACEFVTLSSSRCGAIE